MTLPDPTPSHPTPSDEELMRQLAGGRQEALGPLYSRYARLIFNVAARALDRAAAEEIVQEVFLAVWRKAAAFDPARGAFRPWAMQIAHYRILNELRRRTRRPQVEPDPDGLHLAGLPDAGPEPEEVAWREAVRSAVHAALEELPAPQRQALGLAFFDDLTHEEVAVELNLPLGTAKTRIRSGLRKLRTRLAPLAAGIAAMAVVATLGLRYASEEAALQRDERAIALVTTSETEVLHLTPAPGVAATVHGQYRGRAGVPLAVLTISHVRPAPRGQAYRGWVRYQGAWTSLGVLRPDGRGSARLIAEGPELAVMPDAVEVTLEAAPAGAAPHGPVVVRWPAR